MTCECDGEVGCAATACDAKPKPRISDVTVAALAAAELALCEDPTSLISDKDLDDLYLLLTRVIHRATELGTL